MKYTIDQQKDAAILLNEIFEGEYQRLRGKHPTKKVIRQAIAVAKTIDPMNHPIPEIRTDYLIRQVQYEYLGE